MIQYHNRKLRVDKKGRIKIGNDGDKSMIKVLDPLLTIPEILNMWILILLCQGSFMLNIVVIHDIHFIIIFFLNDIIYILLQMFNTLVFYLPEIGDEKNGNRGD